MTALVILSLVGIYIGVTALWFNHQTLAIRRETEAMPNYTGGKKRLDLWVLGLINLCFIIANSALLMHAVNSASR
jgi:hypothetical protein